MRRSEICPDRKTAKAQPAFLASTAVATGALPAAAPNQIDVEALYFLGPQGEDNIEFDFEPLSPTFLSNIDARGRPTTQFPARTLLQDNFSWRSPSGAQRIPMLLAEFCAYKATLAYSGPKDIADKVGDATDFQFFDTAGKVTGTQGFGCCYDGMVFISMRGTEGLKDADWRVTLSSNFTDEIDDKDAAKIEKISRRFAAGKDWPEETKAAYNAELQALVSKLKGRPGMHLGFAMAWEEVSGKVVAYLNSLKAKYGAIPPIVLTGHSLGGALATVGAYDMRHRNFPVAPVVTFGAPCVGNGEFSESYSSATIGGYSLGDRTVRFVADGDSVPKIMPRWYFRMLKGSDAELTFDNVGSFLKFRGAPMTSLRLIEMAIEEEIRRREKAAAEAEANKAAAKTAAARSASGKSGVAHIIVPLLIIAGLAFLSPTMSLSNPDAFPGGTQTQSQATTGQIPVRMAQAAAPSTTPAPQTSTTEPRFEDDSTEISFWYIVLFFVAALVFISIGATVQSHSVANRYALYLSTLTYQNIRSFRSNAAEPFKARLDAANGDLDRYLRFIRGDTREDMALGKLLKVSELPVRLVEGMKLDIFKAANKDANIF